MSSILQAGFKRTKLEKAEENLVVIRGAVVGLATLVGKLKAPESMARVTLQLKAVVKALEEMGADLSDKLKALVAEQGTITTEKGSRVLDLPGATLQIRPHRTGLDPKKLEKLIRTKGLKLTDYMDEEVTVKYSINTSKLELQSVATKLTAAELDSCKYEESWALQPITLKEQS